MNRQASKTIGITLLLAAGLLVALIVVVFSFSPGVGAQPQTSAVISPNDPGVAAEIILTARADAQIPGDAEIKVDFLPGPFPGSGFILPSEIANPASATATTSKIVITSGSSEIIPSDIQVQGTEVILTIPAGGVSVGAYTITFKKTAGIMNPYYAGTRTITVDDGDDPDDVNTAVIERMTTIDPSEGARVDEFTLTGKGYAIGTVYIFDGDPRNYDDDDPDNDPVVLHDNVETDTGGFEVPLPALNKPGSLSYTVWTRDSEGVITEAPPFRITEPTVDFDPEPAIIGETLSVTVSDWQNPTTGVAAVRIGGVDAYVTGAKNYRAVEYDNCIEYPDRVLADKESRYLSLTVDIPEGVLIGNQTVSLYDYNQLKLIAPDGTEVEDTDKDLCAALLNEVPSIRTLTAELKPNPDPIIQKTVGVISQTQAPDPDVPPAQNIIEVDGGRDQELELRVYPPRGQRSLSLGAGDQIEISLQDFDLSNEMLGPNEGGFIEVAGNAVSPSQIDVNEAAQKLVIRLSSSYTLGAGEFLAITIREGSGILTPEIPRGFDDPDHRSSTDEGYPVGIIFISRATAESVKAPDNNFVEVKNPVSSTVPSATVRVTLVTDAGASIGPSEEIVVDFSGPSADSEFIVPSSISNTRVTIQPKDRAAFNPSGVLVQGARVTLTIPSGSTPGNVREGKYTVTFQQAAGIRNPYSAGNPVITVSSFVEGDEPDDITAVIRRTTTINPLVGPRGTEFTLTGKGYAEGTVTIFHDANYNTGDTKDEIDPGETLASVNTVRGAFTVRLPVRGKPGDLVYRVGTRDSEGVVNVEEFAIESGIFFEPIVGRVGSPLRMAISDWQYLKDEPNPDNLLKEVAAVSIGGETAHVARVVREDHDCFAYAGVFQANRDSVITLEIEVPRDVPEGKQTVSLYGYDQLEHYLIADGSPHTYKPPCSDSRVDNRRQASSNVEARLKSEPTAIFKATVDIDREELALSPPTAARGQKVTITGAGFSRGDRGEDHIASVWIGGTKVAEDPSWLEVGTSGDIAFAVTVPLDVPDGPNEVRIEGTDHTLGEAVLTVPRAVISLDPPMGHRGTDLTITGSGFIANELVFLTYGAGVGAPREDAQTELLLADSSGGFEFLYEVPYTAQVGKRHLITAVGEAVAEEGVVTVEAEASHLIPRVSITTTPDVVSPGERLNILGQGLPSFASVGAIMIEGIRVRGKPGIATDENGSFETDVLVPNLEFGDHSLSVQVAEVIVTHIFTVAPPPLSGPPDQVFKYLIRDGVLSVVWHYDNATQSWSLFDPSLLGEMAALNDLTQVGSGDIVWVNLRQPQYFQESQLVAGWNLIELK